MPAVGKSSFEPPRQVRAQVLVEEQARQGAPSGGRGVSEAPFTRGCKRQSSADVLDLQVGELDEKLSFRHPSGEILQDVRDRDSRAPNAGLATPNPWGHGDEALETHELILPAGS